MENEINIISEEKTFIKLRNIQILLRKESSLKGLCKYKIVITISYKNNRGYKNKN